MREKERILIQEGFWSDSELAQFVLTSPEEWAKIKPRIDWPARRVFLRLRKK